MIGAGERMIENAARLVGLPANAANIHGQLVVVEESSRVGSIVNPSLRLGREQRAETDIAVAEFHEIQERQAEAESGSARASSGTQ